MSTSDGALPWISKDRAIPHLGRLELTISHTPSLPDSGHSLDPASAYSRPSETRQMMSPVTKRSPVPTRSDQWGTHRL